MPSPFPGMDPYLESHWRDVHASLIIYIRDALQAALPAELRARVEERVVLEGPEGLDTHPFFPDLRVIEQRPQRPGSAKATAVVATAEPYLVEAEREPLTEGYIEIIDAGSGNRVVTIIEVLSPTNKLPGDGRQEYLRKQREICRSETNLVEIDLLRAGQHVAAVPLENVHPRLRTHYLVCVRRATVRSKAEFYPMFLSEKLPTVKVPLRPSDADVPLDLQALIEQCYRNGRYEGDLDYRRDPEPPWNKPEAEWADELLRSKGLRPAAPPKKKKRPRKPPRPSDEA
jgi:hypothetical protein